MTMHRLKNGLIAALVAAGTLAGATAAVQASTLDQILDVSEAKNNAARKSQAKIDRLADETSDLLTDYKTVMKQVDGLKVYNARLQRQIENQNKRVGEIEESISQVTVIQRQMTPLVIRMIDGLEQFVELDVPFEKDQRMERVEFLRSNIDRADVSVAEKFRGVLEAYNIELQYGRGIDTYRGTIEVAGAPRDVDFLRIGRIALVYQTTDGAVSGAWDKGAGSFVELPAGEYDAAIRKGIRIAKKQATIELLNMPVSAPEAN
ncbi:hypothetical protein BST95_04080 [Halioglobus japonicus]|uniref:DUF3450 domain-containing protein n=1 Tax=Halioglobus japonicus TaxID=930805 RepID=A0AAP8MCV1_9GAMM|nr:MULTISPECIES: DUF3450 domain-containing protein [Halioglobus]AQA17532.1 hypothetical protein BST95_04080 [Halioglobus japonicus]KZX56121.1 hypothetical protein A3709_06975 [Halioglobus sp. HI00S01]PLW85467.1 DUF3450 domain-containing protein [Halioglobus japonicus]GHD15786.1 DUF3450 domain-containing protein [Halioglobus japonicus]